MPDLPPPCPVGSLSCPCTQGGSCDPGLACEAGTCSEACAVGSLGCACTLGGGCDPGLKCDEAQTCVDDPMLSPPCMAGNQDDCCGDNVLDEFEDCDLGPNGLDDAGECTTLCKFATCGDGFVQTNVEACDGGDNCTPVCTFTTCGDGKVDPWEWCEPRGDGDPECTSLCLDARKVMFVTSEHYAGGEIGGLAGGDSECQDLAGAAGLSGEFRAWLAVSPDDPPVINLSLPIVDVKGEILYDEMHDFCDKAGIPDENGNPHPGCATSYLGTNIWAWQSDSPYEGLPLCGGWVDVTAMGAAMNIPGCVVDAVGMPCSDLAPIICVEQ